MKGIRNPTCDLCELHKSCQTICLMGQGPKKPDIMFVGEAPGATEDRGGLPFQGRAGQLLNRILAEKGIKRENCYVTNAVKCRPPDNATPRKTEIKACNPYLIAEIEAIKPKVIVTLGNTPLTAVTKKSGIMKHRGTPLEMSFGSHTCTVIPTIHPAAILRNPKSEPLIKADLDTVKSVLDGGGIVENQDQKKFKVIIASNKKKLKQCFAALRKAYKANKVIAYDLETEGKEALPGKRIWLMGIADKEDRAWVIPLEHPESPWVDKVKHIYKKLKPFVETPNFWKCAQNGKFDNGWLRLRGLKPYLNFDSILAQHLLDENQPKGLEFLSMVHFKATNWGKGHIKFTYEYNKKGVCIQEPSPLKEMGKYCGIDCIYTLKLYIPLRNNLLEDEKLARIFKYISMPGSRMLEKAERRGIYVDREKLGKRYVEAKHHREKALKELESFVPENFWELQGKKKPKSVPKGQMLNWNSADQVGQFFFGKKKKGGLGLKVVEKTKGGKASTAEHTMIELEGQHPACDVLLEYRKWEKYINTYIEPWLAYSDNKESRMHPTFKIWGTVTGRLSSENPNPQQTPRDKFLRTNLGAKPGWTFVEGDYSQIELRVVAFLSGDPTMNYIYATGGDIHTRTALDVMGITMEQFKAMPKDQQKEFRKMAKAVNFGYVYGMWWKKFKKYAKDNYSVEVTDEEAKSHRERFFKLYRGLEPWHKRQRRIVKATKQVRAPHGRIRHLTDIDSEDEGIAKEAERQAINSPVQGFASGDLTLLAAVLFDRIIEKYYDPKKAGVVLLVHDAIMWDVKDDYNKKDELISVFKGVMENTPLLEYFDLDFTVPIVADVQWGRFWGELEEQPVTYDRKKVLEMIKSVMYYDEEEREVS